MNRSIHLNLERISVDNKQVLKKVANVYDTNDLDLVEYLGIAKNININDLISDYNTLLSDVKEGVSSFNLKKSIDQDINGAIKAGSYRSIYGIIVAALGESILKDNSFITTKLMELNNIYRFFSYLNTMPGSDGKPINLFKLPDYQ